MCCTTGFQEQHQEGLYVIECSSLSLTVFLSSLLPGDLEFYDQTEQITSYTDLSISKWVASVHDSRIKLNIFFVLLKYELSRSGSCMLRTKFVNVSERKKLLPCYNSEKLLYRRCQSEAQACMIGYVHYIQAQFASPPYKINHSVTFRTRARKLALKLVLHTYVWRWSFFFLSLSHFFDFSQRQDVKSYKPSRTFFETPTNALCKTFLRCFWTKSRARYEYV